MGAKYVHETKKYKKYACQDPLTVKYSERGLRAHHAYAQVG